MSLYDDGFDDSDARLVDNGTNGSGTLEKEDAKSPMSLPIELDEWMKGTSFPNALNVILSTKPNPPKKKKS